MENRETIEWWLGVISKRCKLLKQIVDGMSDKELDNILVGHFSEYSTNIDVNFTFMQMILTRMCDEIYPGFYRCDNFSNKQLEKYFDDRLDLLAIP